MHNITDSQEKFTLGLTYDYFIDGDFFSARKTLVYGLNFGFVLSELK